MALDEFERYYIYDYSLQLLQRDLLTNAYFSGSVVGKSLRDMVLARQPVQPLTNPSDMAITGTLRADAASVRQNARNVGEAAAMMGVAKTAAAQISDALTDMEEIIDKINNGELDASSAVVQADYDALKDKIIGLVEGTDYNGIYMLDSTQWGTDQIDANGNVYIQAYKNGGFDITFHPMDSTEIDWTQLDGADLATDLAGQLALVENYSSTADTILDMYESKVGSLEYQQASLENQAAILDQAVEARMTSSTGLSTESILLNLLLGSSGGIIDESS